MVNQLQLVVYVYAFFGLSKHAHIPAYTQFTHV